MLTQTQIDECGEAANSAMASGKISPELRGKIVIDLHASSYSVGDQELIMGVKILRSLGQYTASLDAYLSLLTGAVSQPPLVAPPVVIVNPPSSFTPSPATQIPPVANTGEAYIRAERIGVLIGGKLYCLTADSQGRPAFAEVK